MIQKQPELDRFLPCDDMICYGYDVPNEILTDFFNQNPGMNNDDTNMDMLEIDELSIAYLMFKYLLYLLFGITLLTLGCSISTLIVLSVDKRNTLEEDTDMGDDDSNDAESESEDTETNYTHKYVKELNSLLTVLENENENENGDDRELTNETKSSLSDIILMETTPKGNVIMYYNHDADDEARSSFHYYCDDKSIPFNYLDTVSRKYVCLYKCPQIYRFLEKEMEVGIQKMKDLERKRQEEEERDKENSKSEESVRKRSDSVFATLKNYKTQNQVISGGTGTKRTMNPNQLLLCKNRYKRLGSIEEYNEHLKMKERKEQEPVNIKPISFSDFKKMNQT